MQVPEERAVAVPVQLYPVGILQTLAAQEERQARGWKGLSGACMHARETGSLHAPALLQAGG